MRKIRIAQIGVNFYSHGSQIYASLRKQSDLFEFVGCCLPENERERLPDQVAGLGEFTELTLDEVLNDPSIEAVAIETDEIYLTKYALLAAAHNKHIHMEKPGGREVSDFEKLMLKMKETGKVFHIGYMYRYNPAVQDLKRKVHSGELGQIVSVEAQMSCYHKESVRSWLQELPAGMMFFLGCHLVDLVLQLQGEPDHIIPLNRHTGMDGIDTPDFGMAVLEYPNGVSFVKTTDIERGGFMRRQLVICGSLGSLEIRPLEQYTCGIPYYCDSVLYTSLRSEPDKIRPWVKPAEATPCEPYQRYRGGFDEFAQRIWNNKPSTEEELLREARVHRILLAACGIDCDYKGEITL